MTIELGPHALLHSILKRSLSKDCIHIGLQKKGYEDNLELFYEGIGRLVKITASLTLENKVSKQGSLLVVINCRMWLVIMDFVVL